MSFEALGLSKGGKQILAVSISNKPAIHQPGKPEVKIIGGIHGDETASQYVSLRLIETLCDNYGKNDFVTQLVDNTRIHVLPFMNPDGFERVRDGTIVRYIRENLDGVDINRNFPSSFGKQISTPMQAETRSVIDWSHRIPFSLSISFHSGALFVLYPYEDSPTPTADDSLFQELSLEYAKLNQGIRDQQTKCQPSDPMPTNGIINAYNWYPVRGAMSDWDYSNSNGLELTIELSCEKVITDLQILRSVWASNKLSILNFISQIHGRVLSGFVFDGFSGLTLPKAEIHLNISGKIIKTGSPFGDYWRILPSTDSLISIWSEHRLYYPSKKMILRVSELPTKHNFTMWPREKPQKWLATNDFQLDENAKTGFLAATQAETTLRRLEESHGPKTLKVASIADTFLVTFNNPQASGDWLSSTWQQLTPPMLNKTRILLIGASNCSAVTDLLVRFVTHMAEVVRRGHSMMDQVLEETQLIVILKYTDLTEIVGQLKPHSVLKVEPAGRGDHLWSENPQPRTRIFVPSGSEHPSKYANAKSSLEVPTKAQLQTQLAYTLMEPFLQVPDADFKGLWQVPSNCDKVPRLDKHPLDQVAQTVGDAGLVAEMYLSCEEIEENQMPSLWMQTLTAWTDYVTLVRNMTFCGSILGQIQTLKDDNFHPDAFAPLPSDVAVNMTAFLLPQSILESQNKISAPQLIPVDNKMGHFSHLLPRGVYVIRIEAGDKYQVETFYHFVQYTKWTKPMHILLEWRGQSDNRLKYDSAQDLLSRLDHFLSPPASDQSKNFISNIHGRAFGRLVAVDVDFTGKNVVESLLNETYLNSDDLPPVRVAVVGNVENHDVLTAQMLTLFLDEISSPRTMLTNSFLMRILSGNNFQTKSSF
ncbi:hypothetical protein Ciccas_008097 [Cichlidogyrus casuarinus]|uniref:Peptidase M14 domain-containing protein n=1 Tax=Cichlidogyrus casuarinus TaxID=1844966 RepID=A0ABD2Q3J6_9PLAT